MSMPSIEARSERYGRERALVTLDEIPEPDVDSVEAHAFDHLEMLSRRQCRWW